MPSSSSERSTRARIAAHERWAREPDRSAATAAARAANDDRYLRAARALHPGLSDEEIAVRAANLRSADAARMARARWGKGAPIANGTPQEVDRVSDPTTARSA